jgi:putative ABC transport system permease protein
METITSLWQDLRYGIRGFRKDLTFSLLGVFALALGIGATTIIFSVIDNMLIEPLPYHDSHRITRFFVSDLAQPRGSDDLGRGLYTMPEYLAFKKQNHVFDDVIATSSHDVLYTDKEGTKQFRGGDVSTNVFQFLGIKPLLGRTIVPDDARAGAPPVVVLSNKVWRDEFSSDPGVIGAAITLNSEQRTVVGVMPPRFHFGDLDMWLPLTYSSNDTNMFHMLWLLARRKPGVSLQAVSADIDLVARWLAKEYPRDYPAKFEIKAQDLTEGVVGQFRVMLFALLAAVGMLLLIACSNVANLLLARATAREKEIAIRMSLGAGRSRMVRQLLVESFALAAAGCALGYLLAYGGLGRVVAAIPEGSIPADSDIRLNGSVLAFSIAVTFLTTMLCGLAPALHAVRGDFQNRLKDSGKGASIGFAHGKFRSGLVVAQVGMSIVLLVGAGLMMRSLFAIQHVDLGFNPANILVARTPLPKGRYETAEQKRVFFRQVLQRLSTLPGVVSATETSDLPPYGGIDSEITVPGKTHAETWQALFQLCSEGYFPTLGLRLKSGRLLTESDAESARHVAVINQTLARKFFANEDPIGQSVKFNFLDTVPDAPHDTYFEIIGVVADAKNRGLQDPPLPEAFLPYSITGVFERGVLVRTSVEPLSLLMSVRKEIWSVDRGVALTLTGSLEDYLRRFSYAQPRFGLIVFGAFATIGLTLVAIGIFSVMAYTVTLQTREIGIRMALGAQRISVLKMILGRSLLLTTLGIGVGELASFALTKLIQSQIWGVSAHDPLTFGAVLVVLVSVGIGASLVPARRATQVDPLVALRHE